MWNCEYAEYDILQIQTLHLVYCKFICMITLHLTLKLFVGNKLSFNTSWKLYSEGHT